MAVSTRAVIDVGTNSIKLLVGEVHGSDVTPLTERSEQTRLGKGFYTDHILRADAIEATAAAVGDFAEMARAFGPERIRVIATSAARDAANKEDLLRAIEARSGLPVEIISGAQEAAWAFSGATLGRAFDDTAVLVMDIGGGSTELNLGHQGKNHFSHSFPLGSVRLLERYPVSDPPTPEEAAQVKAEIHQMVENDIRGLVENEIKELGDKKVAFIATGGTSTILARVHLGLLDYDRDKLEGAELDRETVQRLDDQFWSLTLDQRKRLPGMPKKRADVILGGSAIMRAMMEGFQLDKVIVSTRGLRFAALLD